jgi:CrcB protein
LQQLLSVAIAGALGTTSRYLLSSLVNQTVGSSVWGTWLVNIAGCFLFGLVSGIAERRLAISDETRLIILTGFMGAFTTFSTFIFETSNMAKNAQWSMALANLGGQIVVGIIFLFLGLRVAARI